MENFLQDGTNFSIVEYGEAAKEEHKVYEEDTTNTTKYAIETRLIFNLVPVVYSSCASCSIFSENRACRTDGSGTV